MYGLLLENLSEYIKSVYGEEKWEDIRRQAGVDSPSFSVHQVYPENIMNKLAKKAQQILGVSEREFMDQMGVYFIGFVSQYGYDRVLSVLGRHMRDFLNGLDNLHEYLKFSYPRMRAPSFICENETKQGLTLHYRSKRRGFVYYTMGQIREVARHFYHKEMHIELVREEILFDTVHVTFQLTFDNRAFTLASLAMTREEKHLPISAHVLFEIFPFCIVFGSDMVVRSIGNSLMVILPELVGNKITAWFDLVRPLIAFKFQTILNRTNNIFELVTVEPVSERIDIQKFNELMPQEEEREKSLRLKGQMVYMDNWRMIMFLGTPVMPDLTALINTGLYINDLSMHDFSRDLMLAGTQQSVELKLALDQEQQKSKKLEESMRKLDEEMRRTDELLYQMIPKQVADRLRRGENPIDTCEMFDSVSILFSDVVTFTEICSRITPMEVVSMLNAMYSIFDTLTERNLVYKVETIGDAYMVVAGAPEEDPNHAEKVCDMALDMVDAITDLKDPSTGQHLAIRVGVHSGAVVAGIVGLKMPRYCLFGDSVNTAARMESTSATMKIHVSESTRDFLGPNYKLTERGEIEVKGKGKMKTYWLEERENRKPLQLSKAHLYPMEFAQKQIIKTPLGLSKIRERALANVSTPHVIVGKQNDNMKRSPVASGEDRYRIYSPVTFKDVARRSIASSPVRSLYNSSSATQSFEAPREIRSNSIGHVFMRSPTSTFGCLVLDTEEFLEDMQVARKTPNRPQLRSQYSFNSKSSLCIDNVSEPITTSNYQKKPIAKEANANDTHIESTEIQLNSNTAVCTKGQEENDIEPSSPETVDQLDKSGSSNLRTPAPIRFSSQLPTRTQSAPLPISKAMRKALLATKRSKAAEKLDQMIEEIHENDSQVKISQSMRLNKQKLCDEINSQNSSGQDNEEVQAVTVTTTDQVATTSYAKSTITSSMSESNICSHGHSHSHIPSHSQSAESSNAQNCEVYKLSTSKLYNSQSFSHTRTTNASTQACCNAYRGQSQTTHSNGRHSHRTHPSACQLL